MISFHQTLAEINVLKFDPNNKGHRTALFVSSRYNDMKIII